MRTLLKALSVVAFMAFVADGVGAQTPAPDLALQRVDAFWTTGPQQDWFAARFLQAVPFATLSPIAKQIAAGLGAYQKTTGTAGDYISQFEKGTIEVRIHLDADQKIDGFRLLPPTLTAGSIEDAAQLLRALPGTVSYALIEDRQERAALNPDLPLAVGSAFKLAVLAALQDQIAAGHRHWTDVVPLEERWKSLPSGVLQTWPGGTPITLATYAAQMISISDNTAADALAAIVGPEAIAPYAGRNVPYLTTRQLFALRSHPDMLAVWKAGSPETRAGMLSQLSALPLPAADQITGNVGDLSVEWLFTPRELCALMDKVADLPLMSINPGVAVPTRFQRVAFKGGSEPGVFTLVTAVVTKAGNRACLAMTVNNPAGNVDAAAAGGAYGAMLSVLSR
jgi:beta-lactamase class A